jgi:hypothetical protein
MASTKTVSADVIVTGTLDMRGYTVTGLDPNPLIYPSQPREGASKAYVDYIRDGIVAQLPTEVNNGEY